MRNQTFRTEKTVFKKGSFEGTLLEKAFTILHKNTMQLRQNDSDYWITVLYVFTCCFTRQ